MYKSKTVVKEWNLVEDMEWTIIVKIQQGEFVTDLYYKSTDGHQYLHFDSCHASHTKASIVYSQALIMKRIFQGK